MASKKDAAVIEIPQIRLQEMLITIQGKTPLIPERFSPNAIAEIEDKQTGKASNKKAPRKPEEEWKEKLYEVSPGSYGFPASAIKKALVTAGGRFTEQAMTILRGTINIPGDILPVVGSEPKMRCDRVRLSGPSRKTSLAYRPMFEQWEITVPVVFNMDVLTKGQVLNLFNIAGFSIGLGGWRPECNGTFGMFSIKDGGVKII